MLKMAKYIVWILFGLLITTSLYMTLTGITSHVRVEQLPGKYVYNGKGYIDSIYIMTDFTYEHVRYIGNDVFRKTGEWEVSSGQNRIIFKNVVFDVTFKGFVFYNEDSKRFIDKWGHQPSGGSWRPRVRKIGNEIRLYYAEEHNLYYKKE